MLNLPPKSRIVVAMSGGVDSSVAAALMVEAGYEVIGMTMQLYDHGEMVQKKGACCAGQDIYDARRVCDLLGIPHYILDYESKFSDAVMNDFAEGYLRGETPIPCVKCNQTVKFRDMLGTAKDLGAQALVTGHYIRRVEEKGKAHMQRAVDLTRDQSYFLFTTTQEQLDFLRFPLGDYPKTQTRAWAEKFGLEVADKPDSQDICFVPGGNYASVVEKLRPGALEAGDIVHVDGRVLGRHQGIINYTIGQRKGLGIGGGDPFYVVALDPTTHRVIVGPAEALGCVGVILREVNWLGDDPLSGDPLSLSVKIRSTKPPVTATVRQEEGVVRVLFDEPQQGVSPGQACVFYAGDRVLGGGWIHQQIKDFA